MYFSIDVWYFLADSCIFQIDTLVYIYWKKSNTLKIQQPLYSQVIYIYILRNWVHGMLLEPLEDVWIQT